MQDCFAGDIGDFVKIGLLRALSVNRRLGVSWYRYPNQVDNSDGRHISYLNDIETYKHLDPDLFVHLKDTVLKSRKISSLEIMLEDAVFFDDVLDVSGVAAKERRNWRKSWFERSLRALADCDLVFADPDNGLIDDEDTRKGAQKFGKQIPLAEAKDLASGRCAVIYHHNTRRPGGHDAEVDYWIDQLDANAIAIRARAFSPRTFFILNPDLEMKERAEQFCRDWGKHAKVSLHTQNSYPISPG